LTEAGLTLICKPFSSVPFLQQYTMHSTMRTRTSARQWRNWLAYNNWSCQYVNIIH